MMSKKRIVFTGGAALLAALMAAAPGVLTITKAGR